MELFSLICFVTLAEYRKFSDAADALYLSQSAFSKQIQALEKELGAKLFSRNAWTTELTDAGSAILPFARGIVEEYERTKTLLTRYKEEEKKRISVTTFSFLAHYGLASFLFSFMQRYPEYRLEVEESDGVRSFGMLNNGDADACIIFTEYNGLGEKYDVHPLMTDKLVLCVGTHHRLARRSKVHLAELHRESFQILHRMQEAFLYSFIVEQCKKSGFTPNVNPYGLWINAIEDMILEENCVSLLPLRLAEYSGNPKVRIIAVDGVDDLHLSLVSRSGYSTEGLLAFVHYASEYLNQRGA